MGRDSLRMASINSIGKGRWRAQVARKGVRRSKIFDSKQAAKDWAARQEYLILNSEHVAQKATFGEVMNRYANEVSPTKRGERWEIIRLKRFRQHPIADVPISELRPQDFAEWRDARLKDVAPASVNREMVLMSAVLTVARKEWGLIDQNPMADVRKPSKPPPRDRIATDREMEALALSAGEDLTKATARAFQAFLFAIETGMRAGEIVGLRWEQVDLERRVAHLPKTKNGFPRDVPLSSEAVRLIEALPYADPVFRLSGQKLDALWRKLRNRAAVADLHFHDSRHMAVTRLAKKLDVLDLARMIGHRNVSQLLAYYNASASDIAKLLD